MEINALITGTTGMLGKAMLLECLQNDQVTSVISLGRNKVGIAHPKLTELVNADFTNFESLKSALQGVNACFFCMGISAAGLSEEKYHLITHDYTLALAKTLKEINPEMSFCYVSGAGTDSTEKGRMMWARVKGKTENDLIELFGNKAFMFRPGYIQPLDGLKSRTALYNALYFFTKPFYFMLKHLKNSVTDTRSISKAMINAVLNGTEKRHLGIKDINDLSEL